MADGPRRSARISNKNHSQTHPNDVLRSPSHALNETIVTDAPRNLKTPRKRKRKKNTVLWKNRVSESESDLETEHAEPKLELDLQKHCSGSGGRPAKRRRLNGKGPKFTSSLIDGPSSDGWTKEQEIALHNAYHTIIPSANFWNQIAKLVPGKSSKECFDRFYSAYPTPRTSQPLSRTKKKTSGSPGKSFASDVSKLLNLASSNRGRYARTNQKMLNARKTVRKMLRHNKNSDKENEADLYSTLEKNPLTETLIFPPVSPITPYFSQENCEESCQTFSRTNPKRLTRFSEASGCNLQSQFMSPEVLKPLKSQHHYDRYIDRLHSRDLARNKAAERGKFQLNHSDRDVMMFPQVDPICAARAAVVAEAEQMIEWSQANAANNSLGFNESSEDDCDEDKDEENFL